MSLENHTILGVRFKVGSGPALVDHISEHGGLVVVPSAPVLVGIAEDVALREAVLGADMAITDSGLMVLLWRLLGHPKLERVSGLEYLKLLLERPENKLPGALFFVMPGQAAMNRNLAWLQSQGFATTEADCYLAPFYGPGAIRDDALLTQIAARRPRHVIMCLGGGVQERVAYYLRNEVAAVEGDGLEKPVGAAGVTSVSDAARQAGDSSREAEDAKPRVLGSKLDTDGLSLSAQGGSLAAPYRPSFHCIGAAIGFLTGDQVRIPMWVDYLYLGWLWRIASAPTKFFPRYWKATRLVGLMWQYGEKAPPIPVVAAR